MVEGISSSNISYGISNLGVLNPPNELPKPHIYSDIEAEQRYHQMQNDLYLNSKKAHKPKRKFPAILKILGGLALLAGSCLLIHKPITGLYEKIFRKKTS